MKHGEKLRAILAAVQVDPGQRGLARDPHDNLFTATDGDFAAACHFLLHDGRKDIAIFTGFYIPSATPPAFETDGPLGAVFLARTLIALGYRVQIHGEEPVVRTCQQVLSLNFELTNPIAIAIERGGPGADGRCRTMRGIDMTEHLEVQNRVLASLRPSIGIGDGGNEIGMGKIAHETIVKNIPNGDLVHCRITTDFLIVAGVSNWGAYALAAGLLVLTDTPSSVTFFDANREAENLREMVREGPLVDGVTGLPTATVDGLSWAAYLQPFLTIREILQS
jgi:D-glutamate cyclase